jgi:raffinose/stachyose/melibiose transport system permease protein
MATVEVTDLARERRGSVRRPHRTLPDLGYAVYLIPGLLLFAVIIIFPLLANIGISFTEWSGVGTPEWVGLENYSRLLGDDRFWASTRNNLAMIVAMAVIPTIVGLFLAAVLFDYVAVRIGQRWATGLRAAYYVPQVLPIAVAGVVWGWILNPSYGALNFMLETLGLDALTNNWLGDRSTALLSVMGIMIWFQIGYPLVMFMAGLQRVDPELYEAAEVDGASWFQRFWFITIHMIRPEIFVVLLTTTIAALKVFAQIFVLTRGGPGDATLVPSYFAYQNFFERADVGYGASIATVMMVIIIGLTIVFLRVQNRREMEELR